MCPWCFLTPACPCRRGGEPPGLAIGKLIVAVARRLRRFAKSFDSTTTKEKHDERLRR
jgi:hypothetical protein